MITEESLNEVRRAVLSLLRQTFDLQNPKLPAYFWGLESGSQDAFDEVFAEIRSLDAAYNAARDLLTDEVKTFLVKARVHAGNKEHFQMRKVECPCAHCAVAEMARQFNFALDFTQTNAGG